MNARYPYLFALALTLPLSSCRFVGLRPDFTTLISSFREPVVDEACVEDASAPVASITAATPASPTAAPPVLQLPGSAPVAAAQQPSAPLPTAPAAAPTQPAPTAPALVSQQQPHSATPAAPATPQRNSSQQRSSWLATQLAPTFSGAPHPQQATIHVVQPGDSLSRIARIHKVPLRSLAAVNGIDLQHSLIRPGQKLIIPTAGNPGPAATPKPAATPPTAAPAAPATAPGQYRVCAGDTLYRIARQHGISLQALMQANNLNEESARSVRVGTLLTIPTRQ